jgi:hypothetical protein
MESSLRQDRIIPSEGAKSMAKPAAGRSGPKSPAKAWRPKPKKARPRRKGISPLVVLIALAVALSGGVWIGHFAQDYFNEGVIAVSGVQPKTDMPPHPSREPIAFQ